MLPKRSVTDSRRMSPWIGGVMLALALTVATVVAFRRQPEGTPLRGWTQSAVRPTNPSFQYML